MQTWSQKGDISQTLQEEPNNEHILIRLFFLISHSNITLIIIIIDVCAKNRNKSFDLTLT